MISLKVLVMKKKKVSVSIIEAFSGSADGPVPVKDLDAVLRMEYRSKMLNPKYVLVRIKKANQPLLFGAHVLLNSLQVDGGNVESRFWRSLRNISKDDW